MRKKENKEENQQCFLKDDYKIYMVENWDELSQLMIVMEKEPVIGLDAEWKPNFTTMKEL